MKKILIILFSVLILNIALAGVNSALSSSIPDNTLISDAETVEEIEETENQNINSEVTEEPKTEENSETLEEVLGNENNPITNPGGEVGKSEDNSVSDTKVKNKKEKKKKSKKEKPKYGKYKDADTDPYIQSWEEELKSIQNGESTFKETPKEETKKTYSQNDYEQIYRDMEVPTFSFVHGIDPDQYYDMKNTTWSPYPLLRLNSPLYFKTLTIEPGYYLLTPRQYKDDWYILFKEAGAVKYTIPVFDKSYTPEFYYRDNLKEADMSRSARWQVKFLNTWGRIIRKSKRKPAVQCNVELTDLDNNFLLLELYYGPHKYSTIFRIEKF